MFPGSREFGRVRRTRVFQPFDDGIPPVLPSQVIEKKSQTKRFLVRY